MNPATKRRLVKSWEGDAPFLVLQLSIWRPATAEQSLIDLKLFLILDAQQKQYGARFVTEKPEGLKPQSGLVSIVRKHCPTAGIGGIFSDVNGDIWLPLFTNRDAASSGANFYLQIAKATPPELRFFDSEGTALMRRSTVGTFTKRRAYQDLTPPLTTWPPALENMTDLLQAVEAQAAGHGESATEIATAPDADDASPEAALLPEYQRSARDKLARRFKTLRKAHDKIKQEQTQEFDQTIADNEQEAALLRAYMHLVKDGDMELALDAAQTGGEPRVIALDPDRSAGQNLEDKFLAIKKRRKAQRISATRLHDAAELLASMERDLATLRGEALSEDVTEAILVRHKLAAPGPKLHNAAHAKTKAPVAKPYRTYQLGSADQGVICLVGKGSSDNDELTKNAKANDYWLHAVGITGSHVIIPARALKNQEPSIAVLKEAAILALHYSRRRDDLAGEVYLTRKQYLRKRRGMAPGLWQIDKSETMFVRYDETQLKSVLDKLKE